MIKKFLNIACVVIAMLCIGSCPVVAEGKIEEDSLNINQTVLEKIIETDNDFSNENAFVLRVYNMFFPFAYGFSETDEIKDLLAGPYMYLEYYVLVSDSDNMETCSPPPGYSGEGDGESIKEWKVIKTIVSQNNEMHTANNIKIDKNTLEVMHDYHILDVFHDNVNVEKTYLLWGGSSQWGTAVFFKTNIGDFVYYHCYDSKEYIFTAKDFGDFQKKVFEKMKEMGDSEGFFDITNVCDISEFEIHNYMTAEESALLTKQGTTKSVSDKQKKLIIYAIGLIVLIGVVILFVICRKRNIAKM